jgi:leader peptidase (prepilin peptidase)/N-methyltransferase
MNAFSWIPIVIGLAVGMAVNYLADVLPHTRRFTRPTCPNCGNTFGTRNYLLIKACDQCGTKRSVRSWIVLLIMAAIHFYIWMNPPSKMNYLPNGLSYLISTLLTTYLGTVFVIDLEHRLILHPTSMVGSLLGLGVGWLSHGLGPALLGGLAGFAVMLLLYLFGVLFSRIRSRRLREAGQPTDDEEALGAGDVILAAIIGLMLGWPLISVGLIAGILLGGVISLFLVVWLTVTRRYKENALMLFLPYGPYFIISTFLILYVPSFVAALVPG